MNQVEKVVHKRAAKLPEYYPAGFTIPSEWLNMGKEQLAFAIYKHEGGKLEQLCG